jgi:tRNA wybutosine-synthesizing protein 4
MADVRGVQLTAEDAVISKLSAVNKGYYRDEFVRFFTRKATRRAPIINRGYYARAAAFGKLWGLLEA